MNQVDMSEWSEMSTSRTVSYHCKIQLRVQTTSNVTCSRQLKNKAQLALNNNHPLTILVLTNGHNYAIVLTCNIQTVKEDLNI